MDYQKIIVLAGLMLCVTACKAVWTVQKTLRKPGEKLVAMPEKVWRQYNCSEARLPLFIIEKSKLIPPQLYPGGELNHRLTYAMCSNKRAEEIVGTLSTRVFFRGQRLVNDVNTTYPMRPGRWRVDTFITLAPDAQVGVYSLELQFKSTRIEFQRNHSFIIEKK